MRAIFQSKFKDIEFIRQLANTNVLLINDGKKKYTDFIDRMIAIKEIEKDYVSTYDMYDILDIQPFTPLSKRKIYSLYDKGIVVGAGSGHDCIDLIGDKNWLLYDLQDERMINKAIGHSCGTVEFNKTSTPDGDTITNVAEKYNTETQKCDIISIDSILIMNKPLEFISLDVEGSAMDVLSGAAQTIIKHKPDLLVSIYHNWAEYLLAIPFLYDFGYNIDIVYTSNFLPHQPHLELSLMCTFSGDKP